ncbi:MAG: hypothetical protein RL701_6904 [Pseudomonadota bacterium]|jgi:signal transduction histidine kinase
MTAALRDASLAAASVLAGSYVCVRLDTAERLSAWVLRWERIQLDDLLLSAGLAICASTWFALRRWSETRRSLTAQRQSEREKAVYVQKLEELSEQLLETERVERARIAELLHDDVGQTLYACRLQLECAQSRTEDAGLRALLTEAHELAGTAMASTRELTTQLQPPILHDLGLAAGVEWLLGQTERRYDVKTRFSGADVWQRIAEPLRDAVFQSVRELIANAVKHAQASLITVSAVAQPDGGIEVHVHDDGRGFAVDTRGFGLFSVERRMAWLGASLQLESAAASGTRARLQLPAAELQRRRNVQNQAIGSGSNVP